MMMMMVSNGRGESTNDYQLVTTAVGPAMQVCGNKDGAEQVRDWMLTWEPSADPTEGAAATRMCHDSDDDANWFVVRRFSHHMPRNSLATLNLCRVVGVSSQFVGLWIYTD